MKSLHAALVAVVASGLILSACGAATIPIVAGSRGGGSEEPAATTQVEGPPRGAPARRERVETSASETLRYLGIFASGGQQPARDVMVPKGIPVFQDQPILRIAPGTDDHQRALIHHAVSLVNRALPYGRHIRIGPDAPRDLAPVEAVPEGQIFAEFAPRQPPEWTEDGREAAGLAWSGRTVTEDRDEVVEMRRGRIWIRDDQHPSERSTMFTAVHELLHTLGFNGHVYHEDWPGTFLGYTRDGYGAPRADQQVTQLGPIDTAALAALVRILDRIGGTAVLPEDLTPDNLGPWDREAVVLFDEEAALRMQWGVRHANGVSVPWTNGIDPARPLARNTALQGGMARWRGSLTGFTPALAPVAGRATITVDLGSRRGVSLDGRADFTALQSWAAGTSPGALGTGQQWRDGVLRYTITVGGNYLRSPGAASDNAGSVNGRFYGTRHQGVAGGVERHDLTAAFGARRR